MLSSPRSISIPPFSEAEPVALEFKVIRLSARFIVSVFTVVVVPLTVKLPLTIKSLKVTLLVVPTACPIATSPEDIVTPVPAVMCALTSEALGPVYVNTPVDELYANEPSPPLSVTETAPLALASV